MKTMLEQYEELKKRHENCVILFRAGRFYVAMMDDAYCLQRLFDWDMASYCNEEGRLCLQIFINDDELDKVIRKLVVSGKRVAICEIER